MPRNRHGVEIVSLAIGIETSGFDTTIRTFADNAGYSYSGVDAVVDSSGKRQQSRQGYAYYRDLSEIPVTNSQRRLVVLNGLADSDSHAQWAPVVNQDFFLTHEDAEAARSAIDSIQPSSESDLLSGALSYADWALEHGIDEGQELDTDADGLSNYTEFHAGTDPNSADREHLRILRQANGAYQLRYPRANRARTVSETLLRSTNFVDWEPFTPERRAVIPLSENQEEVIVALGGLPAAYFRLRLELVE